MSFAFPLSPRIGKWTRCPLPLIGSSVSATCGDQGAVPLMLYWPVIDELSK
jgi:hypothetical protein